MNKNVLILSILVLVGALLAGCNNTTSSEQHSGDSMQADGPAMEQKPEAMPSNDEPVAMEPDLEKPLWLTTELKDVNSGTTFTVDEFKGKPVFLETFAVWCPTCRKQQDRFKELHEELGDSFVSVALNTDPNEDETKVKDHADRNGFEWRFVVAPDTVTQSLIDEFGIGIVSAPSAPVILVCPDQSTNYLKSGLKSVSALSQALDGCSA